MTKTRAGEEALADLHSELARVLKEGLAIRDDDGKPIAALLNVARQFLKDNGIDGPPAPNTPLGELAGLPEFTDEMPDTATPTH